MLIRVGKWSCLALVCVCGAGGSAHGQGLVFSDQTAAAGVVCVYRSPVGMMANPMLAGAAAGDFDGDGWQDLFALGGGDGPDLLFMNNGDGTFTEQGATWGVDRRHLGSGVAVGDVNGDGWVDVYITSHGPADGPSGPGNHLLYMNQGGTGFVENAQAAGLAYASPAGTDGFGASFGDYDLDGDLDLIVCGWVSSSGGNRLFANDGNGVFTDVTKQAILFNLIDLHGFSPRFVDTDGDMYPEILIAADFQTSLYLKNNGDGTFSDMTTTSGTGLDSNGMGATVGDFDNNGLIDWYVTSIHDDFLTDRSGNMLYMNQGSDVFVESSVALGVNDGGWGWGAVAEDFDNDGLLDIAETNGWSSTQFFNERMYLFMNQGGTGFVDQAQAAGVNHTGQGRGLLSFDYDNDGDRDLVVLTNGGALELYRNDLVGGNWLRVFLDRGNDWRVAPGGIGAKVAVTVGGQTQTRWLTTGSNYLSQSEVSAHFGFGVVGVVDEVVVTWPSGLERRMTNVGVDQTLVISACMADYSGDGVVGMSDLIGFMGMFDLQHRAADINGDGFVDVLDFFGFVGAYAMGCP